MAKLTQHELERHLWGAADILRGTVDAGDCKQYIFGLLFYMRLCDMWDEEYEKLLAETATTKKLPIRTSTGSTFRQSIAGMPCDSSPRRSVSG